MNRTAPSHRHTTKYRVIYGDTDSMGIVYHANYLRFFERGRVEFCRSAGFSYADIEDSGVIMPVIESHVRYRAPAQFDDEIAITTWVGELRRVKVRFDYQVHRDGKLLAEGYTMHGCITREGRPVRAPKAFADQVRRAGGEDVDA